VGGACLEHGARARRDAEVLSLFAAIISKLREAMGAEVPRIFEAVFECTLQMITKNFEARPRPCALCFAWRAKAPVLCLPCLVK